MSADKSVLELVGTVVEHAHDFFRVVLENNPNHLVKAKLSGKMRLNKINLSVGDYVKLEVSPYDLSMGRIVSRLKKDKRTEVDISEDTAYANQAPERTKKKNRRIQTGTK